MTELSLPGSPQERTGFRNFTEIPQRLWKWVRERSGRTPSPETAHDYSRATPLTESQRARRGLLRNVAGALASSFQEGMDASVLDPGAQAGMPDYSAEGVQARINAAAQPQDLQAELAAPALARENSRRQFLKRMGQGIMAIGALAVLHKAEPYIRAAAEYTQNRRGEQVDNRAFDFIQDASTVFIDEQGEWYEQQVPAFIAFQDQGFAGTGSDNPLFPGVGYDVMRMTSSTEDLKQRLLDKDVGGFVKDMRDFFGPISDRIDVTYINPTQLEATIQHHLGSEVCLPDIRNIVSYCNPEGSMHKVFKDISFSSLMEQADAQVSGLQQTEASIRSYLGGVHELTADPEIFSRIVREIVAGNIVRFNNIGSEVRDILDKKENRTKVGIPLLWKE